MFVKCLLRKWGNWSNLANMFPFWLKPPSRLSSHRFFWGEILPTKGVYESTLFTVYNHMYDYGVVDYFEFILMEWHGGMGNLQGDVDLEKQNQNNTWFLILNRPYPFSIVFCGCQCCFSTCNLFILIKRSCNCGTIVLNCNILGDDFQSVSFLPCKLGQWSDLTNVFLNWVDSTMPSAKSLVHSG